MTTHHDAVLSATLEVLEHVQSTDICWPGEHPELRTWFKTLINQQCQGPYLDRFVDELGIILPPARAKFAHMTPSFERNKLQAAIDALTVFAWDNRPLTSYQQIRKKSGNSG